MDVEKLLKLALDIAEGYGAEPKLYELWFYTLEAMKRGLGGLDFERFVAARIHWAYKKEWARTKVVEVYTDSSVSSDEGLVDLFDLLETRLCAVDRRIVELLLEGRSLEQVCLDLGLEGYLVNKAVNRICDTVKGGEGD